MKITWLTQGGYLFEYENVRLVVDPYLSDAAIAKGANRAVSAPFTAAQLSPDFLLCTHNHVDHWDPVGAPEILQAHPRCTLLAPASVRPLALSAGIAAARIRSFDVGESVTIGPFQITALPTLHSDPLGVGVYLHAGKCSLYLSGDTEYTTALTKDLATRLAKLAPRLDLALLCINGRLGNMTWREAALLAEQLGPALVVPNHYDLFLENQADPAPFLVRCQSLGLAAQTLTVGVPFTLRPLS